MDMAHLVVALAPAFAAGFALQRLLEILDPILDRIKNGENKKIVLGLISFAAGLGLATWPKIRVLNQLVAPDTVPSLLDYLVTGLIVSGGTEGFNSILKFMSYKKEEKKQEANTKTITAASTRAFLKRSTSMDPVFEALMDAIQSWCGIVPDLGDDLSNLWDRAKGGAVPFDPDGIEALVASLLSKPIFANCPLAGDIGDFLRGDDRTVDDLFTFLTPCGE
jgi:hypothetical protein